MNIATVKIRLVAVVVVGVVALVAATGAHAAAPIKQVLSYHFGWEVDKLTKEAICAAEAECQAGKESEEPGGFQNPTDVAVGSPEGGEDIFVADTPNQRVQELTPAGKFVLMLGREVNATKTAAIKAKGGTPTQSEIDEEDICTQAEIESVHVKCKAGKGGAGAGQFEEPASVVVDADLRHLYVLDRGNYRVQEFTEGGQFVSMFGKGVDLTTKTNVCAAASGDTCGAGVAAPAGESQPGAFSFEGSAGGLLAFGGPEHLLYVGDTRRVQEFEADGTFKREIGLATGSNIASLALEESGDLYLVYTGTTGEEPRTIHRFDAAGEQVSEIHLGPRRLPVVHFIIAGIAIDGAGRLAVSEAEGYPEVAPEFHYYGSLIEASTGEAITDFTVTESNDGGMAFNAQGELYLAITVRDFEVLKYRPFKVAEPVAVPASCVPGPEHESDATFVCTLNGTVNPEEVPHTEAWFEWGTTNSLGEVTPRQEICAATCGAAPSPVAVAVEAVRPNQNLFYRVSAYDEAVKSPEAPLTSHPLASVDTKLVSPKFIGEPQASFVKRSSAVLFAKLNPENASTRYQFQYAQASVCEQLEGCMAASSTPVEQSEAYAPIGTTAEIVGLQPGTVYRYRLVAESENAMKTERSTETSQETTLTTASSISVQATTGPFSAVGTTTASISGSVDSGGQPASYAFELGIDTGSSTQFGIVASGPVGSTSGAVEETLALSGLQPGTGYAYRISVRYGDGEAGGWSAIGAPSSFTTQGEPTTLVSPSLPTILGTPGIGFPRPVKATVKKGGKKKPTKRRKKAKARSRKKPSKGGK